MSSKFRFIDAEQVRTHSDYVSFIEGLREMYRQGCDAMERYLMCQPTKEGVESDMLMQPAWQRGTHFVIKIANVFPGNNMKDLPAVSGLILLFDANTGVPLACIDGTAETGPKTAANSALATDYLARQESEVLLMIGAGNMASHLIPAHSTIRPIRNVLICNPHDPEMASRLAEKMNASKFDFTVSSTEDIATAASEADIISCATLATEPLLHGSWLKQGVHVDLVGSYTPETREADDEVMRRGSIFVDARYTTIGLNGDMIGPMKQGIFTEDNITDLFQLAKEERPGRQSPDEITVFKSGGGGHEDLAVAQVLLNCVAESDS